MNLNIVHLLFSYRLTINIEKTFNKYMHIMSYNKTYVLYIYRQLKRCRHINLIRWFVQILGQIVNIHSLSPNAIIHSLLIYTSINAILKSTLYAICILSIAIFTHLVYSNKIKKTKVS